jgi:hypothetical protein
MEYGVERGVSTGSSQVIGQGEVPISERAQPKNMNGQYQLTGLALLQPWVGRPGPALP